MFTNRPRTYSLGMFLLGFLLISSVQGAFGQDGSASTPSTPSTSPTVTSIANGEKARIAGVIVKSDSCSMTVRDPNGCETVVLITGDTNTKPKNTCGTVCPGRCVKVEGRGNCSGQLVAEEIKFRGNDCNVCYFDSVLESIKQESARLAAEQQAMAGRVDENTITGRTARAEAQAAQQTADSAVAAANAANAGVKATGERISALDDFQAKEEATVTFKTASSTLTAADKQVLDEFAAKALGAKGYMITISGFTDSRGPDHYNNRLSDSRADAVMRYLVSVGNVPVQRIRVTYPGGETTPVASNDTRHGRAENRRATAKLLVSPALAGETLTQTSTDH
jgi:outer membrane protein OmpA-like peptidoglycan-associated protein